MKTKSTIQTLLSALLSAAALSTGLAQAQTVSAQVATDIQVKLTLERITVEAGKEVVQTTERAAPGELVQYVAVYSNTAALTAPVLNNVRATLPIPTAMQYEGWASPKPLQASTDGKTFETYPIVRMIKQADGSVKATEIPFTQYRSLRWMIKDLAPQTSQAFKARVSVAKL